MSLVKSVVFESSVGKELASCPYLRKVLFSRECSPSVVHTYNLCSLDESEKHCDYHGCRLKFSSFGIDSLKVTWICPRIVDFSFLKVGGLGGDVHG